MALVMKVHDGIIGQSRMITIDQIIYVTPSFYGHLSERDRYTIARLIGKLTHLEKQSKTKTIMLIGPGRWGTNTPSLGVPVSFAGINKISVLCEIGTMHEGLVPDLSLGTHFFNDLVELNMLYIGFSGLKKQNLFNQALLDELPNRLAVFLPEASEWSQAVRIIDVSDRGNLTLIADRMKQEVTVYIDKK
jgi:pyruvate,water dikinase